MWSPGKILEYVCWGPSFQAGSELWTASEFLSCLEFAGATKEKEALNIGLTKKKKQKKPTLDSIFRAPILQDLSLSSPH